MGGAATRWFCGWRRWSVVFFLPWILFSENLIGGKGTLSQGKQDSGEERCKLQAGMADLKNP